MNSIILIIQILFIIFFHELGHYLYIWKKDKIKPKIYYSFGSIWCDSRKNFRGWNVRERILAGTSGVLLGIIPILFMIEKKLMLLLSLAISLLDLVMIYFLFFEVYQKKYSFNTKLEDTCKSCVELKKKIKKLKGG